MADIIIYDNTSLSPQGKAKEKLQEYGKQSKPKQIEKQDASLYELLSWQDGEKEQWNYKIHDNNVLKQIKTNDVVRIKYKINKTSNLYTSEYKDSFREAQYSPEERGYKIDYKENVEQKLQKEREEKLKQKKLKQKQKISSQQPVQQTLSSSFQASQQRLCDKLASQSKQNFGHLTGDQQKDLQSRKYVQQFGQFTPQQEKNKFGGSVNQNLFLSTNKGPKYQRPPDTSPQFYRYTLLDKDQQAQLRRRKKRINDFIRDSRFLPNTTFANNFGKPIFEPLYGTGNELNIQGGNFTGTYLLTHNINPHIGENKPEFQQSYTNALSFAQRSPSQNKSQYSMHHKGVKKEENLEIIELQNELYKQSNPIMPQKNPFLVENIPKQKPNLFKSNRFASKEATPENKKKQQNKQQPKQKITQNLIVENNQKQNFIQQKVKKNDEKQENLQDYTMANKVQKQLTQNSILQDKQQKRKNYANQVKENQQIKVSEKQKKAKNGNQKKNQIQESINAYDQQQQKQQEKPIENAEGQNELKSTAQFEQPIQQQQQKQQQESIKQKINQLESNITFQGSPEKKNQQKLTKENENTKHQLNIIQGFKQSHQVAYKVNENIQEIQDKKRSISELKKREVEQNFYKNKLQNMSFMNMSIDDIEQQLYEEEGDPKSRFVKMNELEINPKYYAHLPIKYCKRIPVAGNKTIRSESLSSFIFDYPQEKQKTTKN